MNKDQDHSMVAKYPHALSHKEVPPSRQQVYTRATAVSSKLYREGRRGVYLSDTAVCVAQMGVNFRQSSSTVPLRANAECTIFPSGTVAVTN